MARWQLGQRTPCINRGKLHDSSHTHGLVELRRRCGQGLWAKALHLSSWCAPTWTKTKNKIFCLRIFVYLGGVNLFANNT